MEIVSTPLYPRFLPTRLSAGETVSVIGQVLSLDQANHKLTLRPDSDNQATIEVLIPESLECGELRIMKFVQVRGTAEGQREMNLREYCNLKDNFDLKTYNQVLKLTADPSFAHIFGKQN